MNNHEQSKQSRAAVFHGLQLEILRDASSYLQDFMGYVAQQKQSTSRKQ
jgi:hypothetical protein